MATLKELLEEALPWLNSHPDAQARDCAVRIEGALNPPLKPVGKIRLDADAKRLLQRLLRGDQVMTIQAADSGKSLERRGLVRADFGSGDSSRYLCWQLTETGREIAGAL